MKSGFTLLSALCTCGVYAIIVWPHAALYVLLFTLAAGFAAVLTMAVVQSYRLRGRHRRTSWTETGNSSHHCLPSRTWTRR